jgi:hypothetical protein
VIRRALLIAMLGACGDDFVEPPEFVPVGACDGLLTYVRGEAGLHVPVASVIEWTTNPPATGSHFPSWAGWNRHYDQLDRRSVRGDVRE